MYFSAGNNGNDFGKFESDPILSLFHAALVGLEGFTVPQLDLNCVPSAPSSVKENDRLKDVLSLDAEDTFK